MSGSPPSCTQRGFCVKTLQICCATWSRRYILITPMSILVDCEGLRASLGRLRVHWTCSAKADTRCSRSARKLRHRLHIFLFCCACYSVMLWRPPLADQQLPVSRLCKPAIVRSLGIHFSLVASWLSIPRRITAYHGLLVCVTAPRGRQFGLSGAYMQKIIPDTFRRDESWLFLYAAAIVAREVTGDAPEPSAEQLGRPGIRRALSFTSGGDKRHVRTFVRNARHAGAAAGREPACENSFEKGRQLVSSKGSSDTTTCPLSKAAKAGTWPSIAAVGATRGEMVHGPCLHRTGLPNPSLPPASSAKNDTYNHLTCGRLHSSPVDKAGVNQRKLTAVASSEEYPKEGNSLVSQREAQPHGEQPPKLTTEQHATGRADEQTVNQGFVGRHDALGAENQVERGAPGRYEEGDARRNQRRVAPPGAPEGTPGQVEQSANSPSKTGELQRKQPGQDAGVKADSAVENGESHHEQAFREGHWWRKPSKDAGGSVDHGAPAELSSPELRPIHAETRTTPVPHNVQKTEKADLTSYSLSYQDRFYRAKDTPKTYGESGDSAVAAFAWEKSREPSLDFGTQYRQQWLPDDDHAEGTDAHNKFEIREFSGEGEVFDEVEWTDPESISRAESLLRNQMRALERHVAILEDQLKGVEADVEVYRAGIEGVNPRQHADTFEKLVRGGQSSSQQVLLEKLRAASESLESRVKMYVRTNTTFYASQLNDIVQVRLAPLRQGVLDLSLSLMDAASSTIDVTRQLHEAASHVNATAAREAGQMEALRARREAAFTEALEQEEIAMEGQLVASKQREQRRVNKSSVEEQILLSAIDGAVEDLNKRGFAVLDFSAVYPESEARKVLDLTLHFVDLRTRPRGWEVLPIVIVPSSGFLGRTVVPQAASDWLTSALVSADGTLPALPVDPIASPVPHEGGVSAEHDGRRRQDTNDAPAFESAKGALPTLYKHRRSIAQILEDDTTMADAFSPDTDFDSGVADDGGEHSFTAKQNDYTRGAKRTRTSRRDLESRTMLAAGLDSAQAKRSPSTLDNTRNTPSTDLNGNSSAGDVQQGDTGGRFPSGNYVAAQDGGMPTNANVGATLRQLDECEKHGVGPMPEHFGAPPLRRTGVLEMNMKETRNAKPTERNSCATERACSGNQDYRGGTGIIVDRSSLRRKQSRRLSVLEGALGGHYIQELMQSRTRRTQRSTNVTNTAPGRAGQTSIGQLLRATQFILGETYAEEDQAETGRWQTGVLRQTHAVVASWLGNAMRARGETWNSCRKCSILPPTSTLQHLVREHFRTLPSRQTVTDLLSQGMGARVLAVESTPPATGGIADGDSVDVHSPASTIAAPNVESTQRRTARGRKKNNSVQVGALGSRLGYYILRAEQILLEGVYVAPGGEVSSVLLRYPHLRDLGALVPASQYGVQLLRQLVMSSYAKSQLHKGHSLGNATAVAEVALADKNEPQVSDGRTMRKKHNHRSHLQADAYPRTQPQQRVGERRGKASEGVRLCTPASYNPFSGCLSTPRLPGLAQGSQSSAAGVTRTDGPSGDGDSYRTWSATEEDLSHWDVSPDHASNTGAGVRPLAKHARLQAGSNYGSRARVESSQMHTSPQKTLRSRPLEDAKDADKELFRRKVLIIHLGSRSEGLPLDCPDGAGGKALQRQRLLRHSLLELLASSDPTDRYTEDCGNCSAGIQGTRASEPPGQEPHKETKLDPSAAKKGVSRKKGSLGTAQDAQTSNHEGNAYVHTARKDQQLSARFGDLDGAGAASFNAVKLAKSLQDVHLESAILRQLFALAQELQLASPSRWAADGALAEKYLENHQVEISVAWGRPPPALRLPLTPFFTRNILLIRVEVEKCPKKYGDNSYSVPPNSVVEHALYLLAHPVAGLAAIAAFHHGRHPAKRLPKQLRKAHRNLDVTASAVATHAAHFWGRATGASRETFWIAHIRVKAPGHPTGSAIELLDGRLSAEAGSFVPLARLRKGDGKYLFPAEVEAWGWSYAEPLQPDKGPFLQGRLAGYGEAAETCKPVEALVQTMAANLHARVIPNAFVSDLRGRSVVLAISSTEMPFEGEQIVSTSGSETGWHAGTPPRRQ